MSQLDERALVGAGRVSPLPHTLDEAREPIIRGRGAAAATVAEQNSDRLFLLRWTVTLSPGLWLVWAHELEAVGDHRAWLVSYLAAASMAGAAVAWIVPWE